MLHLLWVAMTAIVLLLLTDVLWFADINKTNRVFDLFVQSGWLPQDTQEGDDLHDSDHNQVGEPPATNVKYELPQSALDAPMEEPPAPECP